MSIFCHSERPHPCHSEALPKNLNRYNKLTITTIYFYKKEIFMKHKFFIVSLAIVVTTACLFCLPACNSKGDKDKNTSDDNNLNGEHQHDWDDGQIITEASCGVNGSILYTCKTDSSHTKVEIIEALNHNFVDGVCQLCGSENQDTDFTNTLIYELSTDKTHYTVTGIESVTDSNIIIPKIYNGLPVTEIEGSAFSDCSNITSVIIGDSVTSIGSSAFSQCSALESITIPDSVISIGISAFRNCSSLKTITIPNSITSIANYTFYGCTSLESIIIPDSVTTIGIQAFYKCSSLKTITIPNSITSIDYHALEGCSSLTYNEYDNACYLGNNDNPYLVLVKAKNTDITTCQINDKTKYILNSAFYNCKSLSSVIIPDSVTQIGSSAFRDCNSLTSVIIPNGVTTVSNYLFYGCSSLTNVTIPNSVNSIGGLIFYLNSNFINIFYNGTVNEWNNIKKSSYWDIYYKDTATVSYTIHYTDGEVNN
jgi:hypothetical protein